MVESVGAVKEKKKPVQKVRSPVTIAREKSLELQRVDDVVLFELWDEWRGEMVDVSCRNGERFVGVLRAAGAFELLVETAGGDVVLLKGNVGSVMRARVA